MDPSDDQIAMLEHTNPLFRIISRTPASATGLARLRVRFGELSPELEELYSEVGDVDFEGPEPRYFRFWEPEAAIEADEAYRVATKIADAIAIGSDGGGHLILARTDGIYSAGAATLSTEQPRLLAPSLKAFLDNPEPLWPWIEEDRLARGDS